MLKDIKHIHFIGIGGYGMSALARVLLDSGYKVSGSDQRQTAITAQLQEEGALVYQGHQAKHVDGAELVIYSTAIAPDNVELTAAREAKIPVWHRSELLAQFINGRFGIAVAGAHGKTTTTSMVAAVLTRGQLDPTAFIGGIFAEFNGNSRIGRSEIVVAEADESDNTFLRYRPRMAVVTNIDADHLEHYQGDFNCYLRLIVSLNNITADGTAVLCADDPTSVHSSPMCGKRYYGCGRDWRAENPQAEGWGKAIKRRGRDVGRNCTVCAGYSCAECAAAVAVARELEADFTAIKEGLESFRGADRRFQLYVR